MELTEIIFRLFAWVRPLLWHYHRLGHVLEAFLIALDRPGVVERVRHDPERRRQWAGIIADMEHVLDIAIGLRTRELLGHAVEPEARPSFRQKPPRIRIPPDLETLMLRLVRLIARYNDIERLAQLRARRIKREMEAAAMLLVADHRPKAIQPSLVMMLIASPVSPAASYGFAPSTAGQRIRAPPWLILIAHCRLPIASRRVPARTRPHASSVSASSTKLPT